MKNFKKLASLIFSITLLSGLSACAPVNDETGELNDYSTSSLKEIDYETKDGRIVHCIAAVASTAGRVTGLSCDWENATLK